MASSPAASLDNGSNSMEVISCGKKQRKGKSTYLLEELQFEILLRVPAKSAVRFRSVSKSWRSMLDSRFFVDSYYHRQSSPYPDQIMYTSHTRARSAPRQSFLVAGPSHLRLPQKMRLRKPEKTIGEIWSRCYTVFGPLNNGIYCLVGRCHHDDGRVFVYGSKMAFCNPATHDYKFTPFPRPAQEILSDLCMVKKYPCRVSYGFGFHKIENEEAEADRFDYKIVVVINWGAQLSSLMGFLYSSRAGEWKLVADYTPSPRGQLVHRNVEGLFTRGDEKGPEIAPDLELCPQRFFKGCWHWMAKAGDNGRYSVSSYDFRDEAFRLIGGPAGYTAHSDATTHVKAGVLLLNDHLAAIYLTHNELQCVGIDVWMMMEYGVVESWARIYTIKPDFSGELCRLVGVTTRPLRDDENSKESGGIRVERVFFQTNGARIVSFDAFGYNEHCVCDTSSFICWNTLGISSYKETLERL